jgi:phosphate transport system substrate-binding protein
MEWSFATQSNIPYAKVGNAGGKFVALTPANVANFLAAAKVVGAGNDLRLAFDYTNTDPNAYPNLLVTYEIVCSSGNNPAKAALLKNFLSYISSPSGQATLNGQGYVPLPANLRTRVGQAVAAIGSAP